MTGEYERLLQHNRKVICNACGGPLKYQSSGVYVCDSCGATEYDDFGKIKMYLAENGPTSKEEIVAATGVSKEMVARYLKEQRLMVRSEKKSGTCRICGSKIANGLLCANCAAADKTSPGKKGTSGKMRFRREK